MSYGSIPVHTGNTREIKGEIKHARVYPRTHGEYSFCLSTFKFRTGLSPYTRGIRQGLTGLDWGRGSIPVHTGNT